MAVAYLVWLVLNLMKSKFCMEHFTEVSEEDKSSSSYESRMNVMKVFDTVLHRKPTNNEIEKYSKIHNEQDMLVEVLADFNVLSDKAVGEEFIVGEEGAPVAAAQVVDAKPFLADAKPKILDVTEPIPPKTSGVPKNDQINVQLDAIVSAVSAIKNLLAY
jgi:hypothetical protein